MNRYITLTIFSLYFENFYSLSILYSLLTFSILINYNYKLLITKPFSYCTAVLFILCHYLLINDSTIAFNTTSFNNSIINDGLSFFSKYIICIFSLVFFLINSHFLKNQKIVEFEYLSILLFAILGLILICSSNDLLISYLSIEISGLACYILAAFKKKSSYSIESGFTYFVIGAVSSALFLLGSSFLYGFLGSIKFNDFYLFSENFFRAIPLLKVIYVTDIKQHHQVHYGHRDYPFDRHTEGFDAGPTFFLDWWHTMGVMASRRPIFRALNAHGFSAYVLEMTYHIAKSRWYLNQKLLSNEYELIEIGITFILFSLFIKLALFPAHLWSLNVFEGSPSSSVFFFSVLTKLSIFTLLIRICYLIFFLEKNVWDYYSAIIGVLSVFIGSFAGLWQRKLKILLAYSSTSHMGYLLLAFSTAFLESTTIILFYFIVYMIAGTCFWSIFLLLNLKHNKDTVKYNKELGDLSLLKKSNIALAFGILIIMFSMAGVPPMIGFLAKMNLFIWPIMRVGFELLSIITIILSVLSTFYYIRIVKVLYFENTSTGRLYFPVKSGLVSIILSFFLFLLIFLFIFPSYFVLFCQLSIEFTICENYNSMYNFMLYDIMLRDNYVALFNNRLINSAHEYMRYELTKTDSLGAGVCSLCAPMSKEAEDAILYMWELMAGNTPEKFPLSEEKCIDLFYAATNELLLEQFETYFSLDLKERIGKFPLSEEESCDLFYIAMYDVSLLQWETYQALDLKERIGKFPLSEEESCDLFYIAMRIVNEATLIGETELVSEASEKLTCKDILNSNKKS